MDALKYWLKAIAGDVVMVTLFVLWQREGVEGAGNALIAALWFFTVLRILLCFVVNKELVAKNPRPPGFGFYHYITEVVVFLALSWVGHPWLASLHLTAVIFLEGARQREPRKAVEA